MGVGAGGGGGAPGAALAALEGEADYWASLRDLREAVAWAGERWSGVQNRGHARAWSEQADAQGGGFVAAGAIVGAGRGRKRDDGGGGGPTAMA